MSTANQVSNNNQHMPDDQSASINQRCLINEMPEEILSNIFDYLPIYNCQVLLQTSKHNKFKGIYKDRISAELYFTKNFYNGSVIMNILRITDAYLYGSRATEYFVPGSTVKSSDWNFCLPNNDQKAYHFLKYMENIGVVWQSSIVHLITSRENFVTSANKFKTVMPLCNLPKQGDTDTILNTLNQLESSGIDLDRKFILGLYDYTERSFTYYILESRIEVHEALKQYRKVTNDADSYIVNGILKRNNIEIKIKAMHYNHSPANHIKYLIYSPVTTTQCFISAFAAGHMYGNLTARKRAHVWNTSKSLIDPSSATLPDIYSHKYRDRDYLVEPKTQTYTVLRKDMYQRSLSDNASLLIKFTPNDSWTYDNWMIVQDSFCSLTWTEHSKDMRIFTPNPYLGTVQYPNILEYFMFRQSLFELPVDYSYLHSLGLTRD